MALEQPYDDPYALGDEVRFIQVPRGAGLIGAMNLGIGASRAAIVHLVTCGTTVREGWADAALARFDDNAEVAAVAPLVVDASGQPKAAGMTYFAGGDYRLIRISAGANGALSAPRAGSLSRRRVLPPDRAGSGGSVFHRSGRLAGVARHGPDAQTGRLADGARAAVPRDRFAPRRADRAMALFPGRRALVLAVGAAAWLAPLAGSAPALADGRVPYRALEPRRAAATCRAHGRRLLGNCARRFAPSRGTLGRTCRGKGSASGGAAAPYALRGRRSGRARGDCRACAVDRITGRNTGWFPPRLGDVTGVKSTGLRELPSLPTCRTDLASIAPAVYTVGPRIILRTYPRTAAAAVCGR